MCDAGSNSNNRDVHILPRGQVIGLCGKMGTGKSTGASIIKRLSLETAKKECVEVSFADTLKVITNALVPSWSYEVLKADTPALRSARENLPAQKIGNKLYTPREALQFIGTDIFRKHMGESIWVDVAKMKINNLLEQGKNVIVSDCRFVNEIDAIKELGGTCIILWTKESDLVKLEKEHTSEHEFLDRLASLRTLHNDKKSMEVYEQNLESIVSQIFQL